MLMLALVMLGLMLTLVVIGDVDAAIFVGFVLNFLAVVVLVFDDVVAVLIPVGDGSGGSEGVVDCSGGVDLLLLLLALLSY